jgi:hypothetical protein
MDMTWTARMALTGVAVASLGAATVLIWILVIDPARLLALLW